MHIRLATPDDAALLIAFNVAVALETEGKELLPEVVGAGVRSLLANRAAGFYVIAEDDRPVGALMITTEWSDWRNGSFWWVQSVYVRPESRRRGVYKALYRHVQDLASQDPKVCGFRLYVEKQNRSAQTTYRALGMKPTHYLVFEELKPDVRFHR